MRKILLTVSLSVFFVSLSFSQNPLRQGYSQINGGVGISGWGIPIYAGYDYAFTDDITIGGEVTARTFREDWHDTRYRRNVIGLIANGNYHFNNLLKIQDMWDCYAGANLGFYIWNSPAQYDGTHNSGLGFGIQIGGRYYFNDKMGFNLEFGGGDGFSSGKAGISIKL